MTLSIVVPISDVAQGYGDTNVAAVFCLKKFLRHIWHNAKILFS